MNIDKRPRNDAKFGILHKPKKVVDTFQVGIGIGIGIAIGIETIRFR